MAVYEINGQRYELPDDLSGDQLNETLMQLSEQTQQDTPAEPQQYTPYGDIREDIDPDTLATDSNWLRATRTIHKMNEGRDWEGSDEELAEYGLDVMGWFNYNLPAMAVDAAQLQSASQDEKEAFLYLMDSYDNLNMSWGGTGRFFKGVLTDPTTYIGLGTLGLGLAGKEGAKQAGKAGLKELLKRGVRTGVVAGTEGAIYSAADNTMRQGIEVSAGRKEEIDDAERAIATGLGFGAGLLGGTVLDAGVSGISQKLSKKAPESPTVEPGPEVTPRENVAEEAAEEALEASPEATPEVTPETPRLEAPQESAPVAGELVPARAEDPVLEGEIIFEKTLKNLRTPQKETDLPFIPRNMEEVTAFARDLGEDLKGLQYTQAQDIVEELKTAQMTQAEWASFNRSTQIAVDELRVELAGVIQQIQKTSDPEKLAALAQRQQELEGLLAPVATMDEALSSLTGSALRQRQEGLTELRGLSPESLMKEGMTEEEANAEFARRVNRAWESKEVRKRMVEYDQKIDEAFSRGDTGEAARLVALKSQELPNVIEGITGADQGLVRKLNELFISNVFSPTTLMINMVPSGLKTVYRPALDALLKNPLEAATRKELMSTYSAMGGAVRGAFRAALASYRYEQSILTRETGRLFEGELAIKGVKGGVIRFFPRMLSASDEFLSQIAYQGYIAGDAAGAAYEAGVKKGLKGKDLDSFVKDKVKKALDEAYAPPSAEESVHTVLNKGINLGYSGDELAAFAQRAFAKDPEALRHGHNQEALDYVRDVLYKRKFSGENTASKLALGYERLVNEVPILRLAGQLFFRTPVRVFEEGIRMTPGLQVIAPRFMSDLAGKNGPRAQARAQGEALMSMAFTGTVLSLYSQGRITGDGAYDHWKQQRNRTDSDLPEPYTITFEDGTTWSYRNFDPMATPLKIMVNALERYDQLTLRERQGEFIDKSELDHAVAAVTVATGAVAMAIRDANLTAGIDGTFEFFENLGDPEAKEGAWVRLVGEKLRMLVPNTMHKIARTNDPTMDDPLTFWQMLESRLLSGATLGQYDKSAPKSYDILGNVRQLNDVGAMWNIFSPSTPEERKKGRSEVELDVLRKLDQISRQTGVTFAAPYKHSLLGNVDLRKAMTSDGEETLYDRWQRYYKELHPEEGLSAILGAGLPVGTKDIDGAVVGSVRKHINTLRDAAFYRLMAEEAEVTEGVIQNYIREAEVKSGFWDQ